MADTSGKTSVNLGKPLLMRLQNEAPPEYNFSADVRALVRNRLEEWHTAAKAVPEPVGGT